MRRSAELDLGCEVAATAIPYASQTLTRGADTPLAAGGLSSLALEGDVERGVSSSDEVKLQIGAQGVRNFLEYVGLVRSR